MKLNIGCGENYLEGCVNIDTELTIKCDTIADIKKGRLPFEDTSFETVIAMHVLEHIEIPYWPHFFEEVRRVLKKDGQLILAYPEFEICAKYFIENYKGGREFWRYTLYGRQQYPGDYHVVPMRTAEVISHLTSWGFADIKSCIEDNEEWSTFLQAKKGQALLTRPELYRKELFGVNLVNN